MSGTNGDDGREDKMKEYLIEQLLSISQMLIFNICIICNYPHLYLFPLNYIVGSLVSHL